MSVEWIPMMRNSVRGACTDFRGARDRRGYGVRRLRGVVMGAHRAAWIEAFGPIPEGMHVMHQCDRPPCVNVDHLALGTPADNQRDAIEKGRNSHGETHRNSRLTADQVREIRELRDKETQASLAERMGVSISTISDVQLHRSWKQLDEAVFVPFNEFMAWLQAFS